MVEKHLTQKLIPYAVEVFNNDCRVLHRNPFQQKYKQDGECKRENIDYFTYKSRARLAFVASNTDVLFHSMMTLTYPSDYPSNGKEVKRHFRNLMKRVNRRWPGVNYLWFLEFQARGAPHYHLLLSTKVVNGDGWWLSDTWYEIVGSGDEKHHHAGTRCENMRKAGAGARYAVKYAMKMTQKKVPHDYANVGRFWGHSRNVKPKMIMKTIPLNGVEDLRLLVRQWKYKHHLDDKPLSVLYGASDDIANTYWVDNLGVLF